METAISHEGVGKERGFQTRLNSLLSLWILWGGSEEELIPGMMLRKFYPCCMYSSEVKS